ncbi:shaker-related potassium channel tsha2-like [Actinia tenebrosa]|uniref:Shaker-related potassium channel tsha2-like n=1 Tax=Actinia tenebrosa TaxID=6105 RepID=A0A6P8IG54_ACTTE|nr:shaker-related potassium channel tsha2-like [Actinia tenebrosa]
MDQKFGEPLACINKQRCSERVVLNVRGSRFETFEKTLQEFPETLLGDTERRMAYYNPINGEYCFDRDILSFDAILFYYQSKGILSKSDWVTEKVFEEELKFYDIKSPADATKTIRDKIQVLPNNQWQRTVWLLLEDPDSSRQAKWLSIFSILVIVFSIVAFCAETIDVDAYTERIVNSTTNDRKPAVAVRPRTWFWIDTFITTWFCLEYVARLFSCPLKLKFILSTLGVIDVLSILPYFISLYLTNYKHGFTLAVLRVFRLLRVSRLLKLTRYIAALRILGYAIRLCHHQLFSLAILLAITAIMFSSIMYNIESEVNPQYSSIFESLWWCIITMTTVGYGDIYPVTTLGKIVGAVCAVFGVVLMLCLPTPLFILNFNKIYCQVLGIELKDKGLTGIKRKNYNSVKFSRSRTLLIGSRESTSGLVL